MLSSEFPEEVLPLSEYLRYPAPILSQTEYQSGSGSLRPVHGIFCLMPKVVERLQGNAAPTVKEVAQLAGVSTATVSRVLSGSGGVRKELAGRVHNAAHQLGYQPNPAARSLRIQGTWTIGMVFPDIENSFYASVITGSEEVLQSTGYSLLLANYGEDPKREHTHLTTLRAEHVAGILCTPRAASLASIVSLYRMPVSR